MSTPSEEEARAAAEQAYGDTFSQPLSAGAVRNARMQAFERGYLAGLASRVSTPPSEAVAQALAFAIKERDEIRGRYAQTGGSLVRYLGYADACDDIIALLQGEATYSVPAVPVPPTEPARKLAMCVACGERVTLSNATDEWEERHRQCKGRGPFDPIYRHVLAPTEPEEKR